MQSVRFAMRTFGIPSPALGIISADEAAESIEYQYLSQGYKVSNSFFAGSVKDPLGNDQGYKVVLVLVKDESEPEKVKVKEK